MRPDVIEGRGLHTACPGSIRFERHAGEVVLRSGGLDVAIRELSVVGTARSTTVADAAGRVRLGTVEHLFAALGGLGLHEGVAVVVEGAEVPLADGGARVYADAARRLGVAPSRTPLRIVRDGVIEHGDSRYELARNDDGAADAIELEVTVDFDDPRIARSARWGGDAEDFVARIAVARTFGFEHELADLLARGLASHVTPESVVVIARERVLSSGAPFQADEPARHKLLDLIGDLYLYGGPPRGRVRASRPGHAATHDVMRRALEEGLVARDGS